MSVGLVAAADFAVVRFVRSVDVRMLFPVGRVGEPTIASVKLAFERLLAYGGGGERKKRERLDLV